MQNAIWGRYIESEDELKKLTDNNYLLDLYPSNIKGYLIQHRSYKQRQRPTYKNLGDLQSPTYKELK